MAFPNAATVLAVFGAGLVLGTCLGIVVGNALGRAAARREWAEERAELVGGAQAQQLLSAERAQAAAQLHRTMEERFEALSAQVLRGVATDVLDRADTRVEHTMRAGRGEVERLLAPLGQVLDKVADHLADSERRGAASAAAILREMELVRASTDHLRQSSGALLTALRRPQARGQWGEMQLRRVVELAGMVERCDFDVQVAASNGSGAVRPDLVIRLTGGRSVVVDAKVPLTAFVEAAELADGPDRAERLQAHARHLRGHVDTLAGKEYWAAFPACPEFVVLFVPGDGFLAAALDSDPALLDHAFARRVHVLTPTTLISALRTIAFEWRQNELTDNARDVVATGRELHKRLLTYANHVERTGRALRSAVEHYNASLGSLERNVVPQSRRLTALVGAEERLNCPQAVDEPVRVVSAPLLVGTGGDTNREG